MARTLDHVSGGASTPTTCHDVDRYLEVGATHVIVMVGSPFDLSSLESLIAQRDAINA